MNHDHEAAAIKTIQAFAQEWALKLGTPPNFPISIGLWVSNFGGEFTTYCNARLGDPYEPFTWSTHSKLGMTEAMRETERKWKADGSPVDVNKLDEAKAIARVKELGYEVSKTTN